MRLTKKEVTIIKSNIIKYIKDAHIILFGSRVDDEKKGGDIDIFVQTKQNPTLQEQIKILAGFEFDGILRKVDLVLQTPNTKEQPIFKTAISNGIIL